MMTPPTFERSPRFRADQAQLTAAQLRRFQDKVRDLLIPALVKGEPFPAGLRVKSVQGVPGVFEVTWAPDGRATFSYGPEVIPGQAHIIWRRIGTHDIFHTP
jgi:hypothetical protein